MRRFSVIAALAAVGLFCAPARAAENDATVSTYHADAARSGHYVVPGLTWANVGNMRQDAAFDGRVPGRIYAQPLYWRPAGAAAGLVIVATEDNVVAALDAISGSTVWQKTLGPPVARSKLLCGNISPTLGITGTPVIDERSGALYLDAMIDRGAGPQHFVFGLSLADGAVLPGWPVDIAASLHAIGMSFDPKVQNQRGALAMVGDRLYLPYHGHYGACGAYHGWVVGLRLDTPAAFAAWRSWDVMGGGNWAPGGISYDGRYLFVSTGPTFGTASEWSGGQAVIRLPPNLDWQPTPQDFFAVSVSAQSWAHDLGVSNPLPFDLPGGGPHSTLLMAFAREGKAYLLDRAELGGIEHPLEEQTVAGFGIITSPAVYRVGNDTMVALQAQGSSCPGDKKDSGVVALRISGGPQPAMHTAWCAALRGQQEAAIVTTSDDMADPIVWIVSAEGDEKLHGFRGDTGQEVFTGDPLPGRLRHFATIMAAEGRLYVAGDGQIFAFGIAH
jgi:hypothetical protein